MSTQVLLCGVCRQEPAVGVASSALGPVSHPYGAKCLAAGAEPYSTCIAAVACAGGYDGLVDWAQAIIDQSLVVAGKSREQLDADVAEAVREMEAAE